MLKLIGSVLVILSTSIVGFYYSRMFSERLRHIRELQYSLTMLNSEIVYSSAPLIQAMEYVASRSKSPIKEFFKTFSEKLMEKNVAGIIEGFEATLTELKGKITFEKDEVDVVGSFFKSLESSDIDAQKSNFNITMKKLEGFEKRAEISMNKNEKLYKYLGVCSGLLIVIILV